MNGDDSRPALLLIGHGTRSAAGREACLAFVDRVRQQLAGQCEVACGFLELSAPTIAEALEELAAGPGQRRIVVVPLLLLAAGHYKTDIPDALREAASRHPDLRLSYGRVLGPDPVLLRMLADRADAALRAPGGQPDPARTAVLLASQGTTDPDSIATLRGIAQQLRLDKGYQFAGPAYLTTAQPTLTEALGQAVEAGARQIVVAQHLLFPGWLSDQASKLASAWTATHPSVPVFLADRLGDPSATDQEQLAALIVNRYLEAAAALSA